MTKPFAVFDIDGTIFRSSLVIELVYALVAGGHFPQSAKLEIQPNLNKWQDRIDPDSYVKYIEDVVAVFMKNLPSISPKVLSETSAEVISKKSKRTYVFTRDLMRSLSKTHTLLAISGSPEATVGQFAKVYGFTDFVATKLILDGEKYTGKEIAANKDKHLLLKSLVEKHSLSYEDSVAVGDTGSDISLLQAVENPIAFNPDSKLREAAQKNSWQIVVERKSEIYKLEPKDGKYQLA